MGCFSLHKPYPAFIYMQNYGLQMFSTSSLHLKKRNGWPKAENLLTGIGFRQCIWESVKVSIKHKLLLHPPPNDELFFSTCTIFLWEKETEIRHLKEHNGEMETQGPRGLRFIVMLESMKMSTGFQHFTIIENRKKLSLW